MFFRIGVPVSLRSVVGQREFTTALKTSDRIAAIPLALELGSIARSLFNELTMGTDKANDLLARARTKLQIDRVRVEMEDEVFRAHQSRITALQEAKKERDADRGALQAQIDTLKHALDAALRSRPPAQAQSDDPSPQQPATASSSGRSLAELIDAFLAGYAKERKGPMFKKHQAALALLRELHGATRIRALKQSDIVDFFNVVQALPPRWAAQCRKRGITARALAGETHELELGKKTFEDNYEVPVRLFLKWARAHWQDQGFPTTLTTEAIEYAGEDDEGKNKQRAMTVDELRRLFGEALAGFREDTEQSHKWWLPALAYYTGARVNELCQLNPQTDIGVSADGIAYVCITEESEADDRIKKSVKMKVQRIVPVHPALIAGGFLEYVKSARKAKAKLLFWAWSPTNNRASTQAERWFRDLLRATGLRDDTRGRKVVGFHAFRSTLLAMAANSRPPVDAGAITGHANPNKSRVQQGYEGELHLQTKLDVLNAIQFRYSPFA